MKKMLVVFLTAAMITTMAASCGSKEKKATPDQVSSAPAVENKQDTPVTKPQDSEAKTEVKPIDVKEGTGIYNGQSDTNFIEVKLDGMDNPVEFSIQEIQDSFKGFKKNDKIKVTYTINENKQYILKSIEKVK